MHTTHRSLRLVAAVALATGMLTAAPPTTQARVTNPPARHHINASSLNGSIVFSSGYIAFDPDVFAPSQVFKVEADGSGLTQLTNVPDGSQSGAPDISPDGEHIAYVSNESGDFGIWVMAADGSGQHPVLETPGVDYLQPRWSPDGSRLAVSGCKVTPDFLLDCDVLVLRADGTKLRRLVGGHRYHRAPVWSPDGKRIAFDSDRGGFVSAIWVVPATGGRPTRLTHPDLEAFWPSWSPNGSKIVFSSNFGRSHSEVYTMRADGSRVRQLTHTREDFGGAWHASYSPSGRRIVLISDSRRHTGFDHFDLFTMRGDGSHLTRIVSNQPGFSPDWGPEGASR